MKRLLLLLPLVITPAAHAVDYVRCEAMKKALERALSSRYGAEMRALRNDSDARSATNRPAFRENPPLPEISPPKTVEQVLAEIEEREKAYELRRSRARSSPQVMEWDRRIATINSDIKKEGCP